MIPNETVLLNLRDSVSRIVDNLGFTSIEAAAHARIMGLLADKLEKMSYTCRILLENSGRKAVSLTPEIDMKHVFRMNNVDVKGLLVYLEAVLPFPPKKSEIHVEPIEIEEVKKPVEKSKPVTAKVPLRRHPTPPTYSLPVFDDLTDVELGFLPDDDPPPILKCPILPSTTSILVPPPPPPPLPPLLSPPTFYPETNLFCPEFEHMNYITPEVPEQAKLKVFKVEPWKHAEKPVESTPSRKSERPPKPSRKLEKTASSNSISSAKMTKKRRMQSKYEERLRNEQQEKEAEEKARKLVKKIRSMEVENARRLEEEKIVEKVKDKSHRKYKKRVKKEVKVEERLPSLVFKFKAGVFDSIRRRALLEENGGPNGSPRENVFDNGVWEFGGNIIMEESVNISKAAPSGSSHQVLETESTSKSVTDCNRGNDNSIVDCVEVSTTRVASSSHLDDIIINGCVNDAGSVNRNLNIDKYDPIPLTQSSAYYTTHPASSQHISIGETAEALNTKVVTIDTHENCDTNMVNDTNFLVNCDSLNDMSTIKEVRSYNSVGVIQTQSTSNDNATSSANAYNKFSIERILFGTTQVPTVNSGSQPAELVDPEQQNAEASILEWDDESSDDSDVEHNEKNHEMQYENIQIQNASNYQTNYGFQETIIREPCSSRADAGSCVPSFSHCNEQENSKTSEYSNEIVGGSLLQVMEPSVQNLASINSPKASAKYAAISESDGHMAGNSGLDVLKSCAQVIFEDANHSCKAYASNIFPDETHPDDPAHSNCSWGQSSANVDPLQYGHDNVIQNGIPTTLSKTPISLDPICHPKNEKEPISSETLAESNIYLPTITDENANQLMPPPSKKVKTEIEETSWAQEKASSARRGPLMKMRITYRRVFEGYLIKRVLRTTYFERNGEWKPVECEWKHEAGVYSKTVLPRLAPIRKPVPKLRLKKLGNNLYSKIM